VTEEEARERVLAQVGGNAFAKLEALAELVVAENQRQNLIAAASEAAIWSRHVLDSTQLLSFAPEGWKRWIDVGTGGGFPGAAIGICSDREVVLVEPRKRRAAFLKEVAAELALPNVTVVAGKVEQVTVAADVISARAVAPLQKLLSAARHCATDKTVWVLPRGRIGDEELYALRREWKGMFHVEPSITDPGSAIVIAQSVAPR
jgi:16S rRNA (guanine527-N7)-methyltransferase